MSELAIYGGPQTVTNNPGDMFDWPIITDEDESAVINILKTRRMSGIDVTMEFEREFAEYHGIEYSLATNNGTAAVHSAMFGCGIGVGDEVICQSSTFWASVLPVLNLGGTVVFSDIDKNTLTLDPIDVERKISKKTKAIIVVHYFGHPTDMDQIMDIAKKYDVKVIEDVSHAHGGLYKGRLLGTIGDVGAMSVMSEKGLAIGEGGILITNNRQIYERAIAFGHYERTSGFGARTSSDLIEDKELQRFAGTPLGGFKYRMHQMSSAIGRVQLKYYNQRMREIQKAMNYFWDLLENVPGIKAHRPEPDCGSTMGGWYMPHGIYCPEEIGGISVQKYCEAVRSEGVYTTPGMNELLHISPIFNDADIYGHGQPTRIANSSNDIRQRLGSLPVCEFMANRVFSVPWFKHYRPDVIKQYADAFGKVSQFAAEIEQ